MERPVPAQSLDEALLTALGEGDSTRRNEAIVTAATLGDPDELVELLAKGSNEIRRSAAVEALSRAGGRSVTALVNALRSADDEVVMYAATALGQTRDASAIPHLIRLVQHPDLNVAQAAIDALGKLRAQSAAAPIEAMLEADPWLRFAAAHALGEIGHPGSAHGLMRATQDPGLSELAIEALGKIASESGAAALANLLVERVGSERWDGVLLALGSALGRLLSTTGLLESRAWKRLTGPEGLPARQHLVHRLSKQDLDPELAAEQHLYKESAIAVLRAMSLPEHYPDLVAAAWDVSMGEPLLGAVVGLGRDMEPSLMAGMQHPDPDIRVFACTALGAMGLDSAITPCQVLLTDGEARVRAASLRTLAILGAKGALPAMLACMSDPDESVRQAAMRTLGTMDAREVTSALLSRPDLATQHAPAVLEVMRQAPCEAQRPYVLAHLHDAREVVRRAAVAVLAANDTAEVIDQLETLLSDPSLAVRIEVVRALGKRRSKRALSLLLDLCERDADTRRECLRSIGNIGDAAAVRRLIALYATVDLPMRLAMIDTLGTIAAPVGEAFLTGLLLDPQPDARGRAVVALGQYTTETAVVRLAATTHDPEPRVRLAALEALSTFMGRPVAIEAFERLCLDPIPAIAALARRCLRLT